MNHYFTSDTHYGHANIVRGTTSWDNTQRCRDFDTLEEHNDALVHRINSVVKENDTLWHMGDWSFGGKNNITAFRGRLNCKNINFILGNHDQWIEPEESEFRHLFNSVQYYKEVKIGGTHFVLCHFAMRVWNKSHKGSIMLYGHSHGTLDQLQPKFTCPTWTGDDYWIKNYKTMDVGVDTHDMYPYHLDEIRDIMEGKDILLNVDHHNESTN